MTHQKRNRKLFFGNKKKLRDKLFMYSYFLPIKRNLNIIQHHREQSGIDELVCN